MKGYVNSYNLKDKIKNEYNNEYGLCIMDSFKDNDCSNYERFFKTKNNLDVHNNILKK